MVFISFNLLFSPVISLIHSHPINSSLKTFYYSAPSFISSKVPHLLFISAVFLLQNSTEMVAHIDTIITQIGSNHEVQSEFTTIYIYIAVPGIANINRKQHKKLFHPK